MVGRTPTERIVEFTPELLGPCTRLFHTVFTAPPWSDSWTLKNARAHLEEVLASPGYVGFAMMRGRTPIAFAVGAREHWSNRHTFYLKEMCVRSDLQGQGTGTRLLQHLHSVLIQQGVTGVYLMTLKGGQAEGFYRKNDYFIIDRMVMMVHPFDTRS